jgi:hypothetical protein
MMNSKTVNKMDVESEFPEGSGNVKKPKGFRPEVKGSEVINPRVDKDESRLHKTVETFSKT